MEKNEKFNLEFKIEVSKTFLKTVSAFSNYNDGEIVFGVDDQGNLIGMKNIEEECLRIENMINDSIEPTPDFKIKVEKIDEKTIIILMVSKGRDTPYYYHGKAYKRSDTSTVEADRFELRRLAIGGINMDYEERRSSSQDLQFKLLEIKLKSKAGIENIGLDILKTLNLYNKEGYYNIAAELLADRNDIAFSGIDIVRFGKDINQILYRETISKRSLLYQYDRAIEIFEQYYQYEEIKGYERVKIELIPKEAFREALANAIVHRVWDVNSYIQISMYEDRIEINSPGGLPEGISGEEYLFGNISLLRNPIIAGVFYRLDIIEKFGTGITRINKEYEASLSKPDFQISKNNIWIKLPLADRQQLDLTQEELLIVQLLKDGTELSRKDLDEKLGFNKSKSIRIINKLAEKNMIQKVGQGPGTVYKLQ